MRLKFHSIGNQAVCSQVFDDRHGCRERGPGRGTVGAGIRGTWTPQSHWVTGSGTPHIVSCLPASTCPTGTARSSHSGTIPGWGLATGFSRARRWAQRSRCADPGRGGLSSQEFPVSPASAVRIGAGSLLSPEPGCRGRRSGCRDLQGLSLVCLQGGLYSAHWVGGKRSGTQHGTPRGLLTPLPCPPGRGQVTPGTSTVRPASPPPQPCPLLLSLPARGQAPPQG